MSGSTMFEHDKEKENETMQDEADKQSDIAKKIGEPDSAAEIKEIAKDNVDSKEEEEVVDTTGPVTDTGHQAGKPKRDTIIMDGKPVEPNCHYPNCKGEAIAQFKDDFTQKTELMCEKHLEEKEGLFKGGNNAYTVKPLMTQNDNPKFQKAKEGIGGKKSEEKKGKGKNR